jgi:hypothetical protein
MKKSLVLTLLICTAAPGGDTQKQPDITPRSFGVWTPAHPELADVVTRTDEKLSIHLPWTELDGPDAGREHRSFSIRRPITEPVEIQFQIALEGSLALTLDLECRADC